MPVFEHTSVIQAPVEHVFAFHEQPDAFEQLTPPWQPVRILSREGGIREGARVVIELRFGPFRPRWVALHTAYEKNRLFVDTQLSGPFRSWVHHHRFESAGPGQTRLTDSIEFSLHGGPLIDFFGAWFARLQLRRLFRYRHGVTRRICEAPATAPAA
jgi:ligand-binding SRPBCC domain-containing protein